MSWKYVLPLLSSCVLAAIGQVLLKQSVTGRTELAQYLNPGLFLGLSCYVVGAVLWIYCLSRVPLLKAYPFTALGFVLTILAGVLIFKETAAPVYWLGIAFILTGLMLVSL
jgi:drug/metabolite transporter (DMT)-like permease